MNTEATVKLQCKDIKPPKALVSELRARAQAMLEALNLNNAELSILLCGDRTIRRLNRDYRDKDRPTDVLAFEMGEPFPGAVGVLLGDVVISLPTAKRQARVKDWPLVEEITFLLAHGLLHLLGQDHRDRAQERRMEARTDLLCAAARFAGSTKKYR